MILCRLITHAHLKKCSSISSHAEQWTGSQFWPINLANQRALLMLNSWKLRLFKRLSNWMNLNYMVANWRWLTILRLILFYFSSFSYTHKCILFLYRYWPSEPTSQEWSSFVPGASIHTWVTDLGGLMCHHISTHLMDMG